MTIFSFYDHYLGEDLYCGGYQSCYDVRIEPLNSRPKYRIDSVTCAGYQSCTGSDIYSTDIVRGYAEYALSGTNLHGVSLVKGYAHRSISGTTIDSVGIKTMDVKTFGYEAGTSSKVICRVGSTCNLVCRNTGCDSLTFRCFPGSTSNISASGCKRDNSVTDVNGIICPTVINGLSENEEEAEGKDQSYPWNSMLKETQNEEKRQKEMDLRMMGEYGYQHDVDITTDTNCTVAQGCKGQTLNTDGVLCYGLESCVGSIMNFDSTAKCYGESACIGAEMNEPNYVYCGAYKSCDDVTYDPSSTGDIVCNRKDSCTDIIAKHTSDVKEMSCFGDSSCKRMEIVSGNYDYLDCCGNRACYQSKITTTSMINCHGML